MTTTAPKLSLRPLVDEDVATVERWLSQDHIRPWYTKPEEWLHEIRSRHGAFSFVHHLIATHGDQPIGFCQYYRCEHSGEPEYQAYWPDNAHSIDYLIGERDLLGRGVGKTLVSLLASLVFQQTDALVIVAQPDRDNAASRATLRASGFAHDQVSDLFVRRRHESRATG